MEEDKLKSLAQEFGKLFTQFAKEHDLFMNSSVVFGSSGNYYQCSFKHEPKSTDKIPTQLKTQIK